MVPTSFNAGHAGSLTRATGYGIFLEAPTGVATRTLWTGHILGARAAGPPERGTHSLPGSLVAYARWFGSIGAMAYGVLDQPAARWLLRRSFQEISPRAMGLFYTTKRAGRGFSLPALGNKISQDCDYWVIWSTRDWTQKPGAPSPSGERKPVATRVYVQPASKRSGGVVKTTSGEPAGVMSKV